MSDWLLARIAPIALSVSVEGRINSLSHPDGATVGTELPGRIRASLNRFTGSASRPSASAADPPDNPQTPEKSLFPGLLRIPMPVSFLLDNGFA
jgi:hypothetical protein